MFRINNEMIRLMVIGPERANSVSYNLNTMFVLIV